MNFTDTIYAAVCLLDEIMGAYAAPTQFSPQFISSRIGGSPTTIGRVHREIVKALRSKGHNVRYDGRKFWFDAPLRLPHFAEQLADVPGAGGQVEAVSPRGSHVQCDTADA